MLRGMKATLTGRKLGNSINKYHWNQRTKSLGWKCWRLGARAVKVTFNIVSRTTAFSKKVMFLWWWEEVWINLWSLISVLTLFQRRKIHESSFTWKSNTAYGHSGGLPSKQIVTCLLMFANSWKKSSSRPSSWDCVRLVKTSFTMVSSSKAGLFGSKISAACWDGDNWFTTATWWYKENMSDALLFGTTRLFTLENCPSITSSRPLWSWVNDEALFENGKMDGWVKDGNYPCLYCCVARKGTWSFSDERDLPQKC